MQGAECEAVDFSANTPQQSRSGCVIIHGDWHKNQLNKSNRNDKIEGEKK